MYQIITLPARYLHSVICRLYLSKTEKKEKEKETLHSAPFRDTDWEKEEQSRCQQGEMALEETSSTTNTPNRKAVPGLRTPAPELLDNEAKTSFWLCLLEDMKGLCPERVLHRHSLLLGPCREA